MKPAAFGIGGSQLSGGSTFGFGAFSKTSAPGVGSGSTTTRSAPGFGFGLPTTTSAPAFGTTSSVAPAYSFGNASQAKPSFGSTLGGGVGGFGTGSGGIAFGTGAGSGLGAFGTSQPSMPFGAQAAPQQQQPKSETDLLLLPLTDSVKIYGDERDNILMRFNQVQAFFGYGKGYYSASQPPVSFSPSNAFGKFKTVVYYKMHAAKDEDGHVGLVINKSFPEVELHKAQLEDGLVRGVLGASAMPQQCSLKVVIERMKPLPENKTDVVLYFLERTAMGTDVRVPAKKLLERLKQPQVAHSLATVLSVVDVNYRCRPSQEEIDIFLRKPPSGIEPIMWEQAKKDNPDPETLLPQVVTRFSGLEERVKLQKVETEQQAHRVRAIGNTIEQMCERDVIIRHKVVEAAAEQLRLSHRVLQLICKQEIIRKQGQGLSKDEEYIGAQTAELCCATGVPKEKVELFQGSQLPDARTSLAGRHTAEEETVYAGLRGRLNALLAQTRIYPNAENPEFAMGARAGMVASQEVSSETLQGVGALTAAMEALRTTVEVLKKDWAVVEELSKKYPEARLG